ncbi:GNAT family N-acetyltransferase [Kitasatospora sp. CB01950]|uniref:GNAT family N-acetyltransferase n=1 Tax=Kitasatospora sp. CB01950 TaxID=1703930 RepID=UPI00093AC5A7|nr:GNAT family N-acetyltransferase [Kitasatospora sp. CB01950]OKJ16706.1 acetyltransferase [Kitasatospora sp. CB01950]
MEIRSTTEKDHDVFVDTVFAAFGKHPTPPNEDGTGVWWSALELDRGLLAVTDEGRPIGTTCAYSFELTLPGGATVPVPGISCVGVLPTHRRQGVLTAMKRRQLADLRERGELMAVLLASEAVIYRRFGYGPATYTRKLTVPRHRAALTPPRAGQEPAGTVELLRLGDCRELVEQIYDRYRRTQPGAISRPPRWWSRQAGHPPTAPTQRYIALHRDADGTPNGYASYSLDDSLAMLVDEIITLDDAAYAALARCLLGHDLVTEVAFRHFPPGNPLRWQLTDFNAGAVTNDTDWLWVRLLDIPRALTARSWSADGELVLDVDDPFLGEHTRHLLTVTDGRAECTPTDREPDLSMDVSDLGSIYLGGTTPGTLVRAGHIRAHHPDAAARADAMFRADREPHCLHWF